MKRKEIEQELLLVRKWIEGDYSYYPQWRKDAEAAEKRILVAFDELRMELGYTDSLRAQLSVAVDRHVQAQVEAQRLEKLLALTTQPEEDEDA